MNATAFSKSGAAALSHREWVVLEYLRRAVTEFHSPSFQEIVNATDLRSKSQVHHAVSGLRAKGWIKADPYGRRSIELSDPLSAKSTEDLLAMRARIDRLLAGRGQ